MHALSLILEVSGDGSVAADGLKQTILRYS
jgi:hypothetical protein